MRSNHRHFRPRLAWALPGAHRAPASTISCRARRTRSPARSAGLMRHCRRPTSQKLRPTSRRCRNRSPRCRSRSRRCSRRTRPSCPAETVAYVAPAKPAAARASRQDDLPAPLSRRQADQFRQVVAQASGRSRRRRVVLAGQDRLAEAARAGRQFRLHQSDRRRRSPRSDVQEELARRRARPACGAAPIISSTGAAPPASRPTGSSATCRRSRARCRR